MTLSVLSSQSMPTPLITVMEDDYVSLWYHPHEKIVHHKIHKFVDSKSFRKMLSTGAEYLEKYHATKWLSDDTNSIVIREEDAIWGLNVWSPRVVLAGFRHWAIVLPTAAVGQLNMRRFAQLYEQRGVTVKLYDNMDEAFEWLSSV